VKTGTMIMIALGVGAFALLSTSKPTAQASLDERVAYAIAKVTDQNELSKLAAEAASAGRNDLVMKIAQKQVSLAVAASGGKQA
jgi:hypothetical protein